MSPAVTHNVMTLADYLQLEYPFNVVADEDDGGYVVEFPDLPGCMTQVDSLTDLGAMAQEAKDLWIESAFESGMGIPLPSYPEPFSGRFNVRLPKSLHRRLVESAAREGVSLNQQVVSLLSEAVAVYRLEERLAIHEAAAQDDDEGGDSEDELNDAVGATFANPRSIFEPSD